MSPEGELANLARLYGWVNADARSATLDAEGLNLALSARTQTLILCSRILRSAGIADDTGLDVLQPPHGLRGRSPRAVTVTRALHRHPVATFAILLERYPRPELPRSLSAYAAWRPRDQVELAWHRIQALAVSAYHLWQRSAGAMSPEQEWDAILDITAITRTLAYVDRDLYTASGQPQVHASVREALQQTQHSWLHVAAGAVDRIANQPAAHTPRQYQTTVRLPVPVPVRSTATLLEGQRRLATLIANEPQTPDRIALIARAHRGIITRYVEHLPTTPPWTTQVAQVLTRLPLHDGDLVTLTPRAAPATMVQLREIQRYLVRAPHTDLAHIAPDGLGAAAAALCHLADVTDKELRGTSWVISHGDAIDTNPHLRWQPVRTPRSGPPRLATTLRTVRDLADQAAHLPPPPPAPRPRIERAATILTNTSKDHGTPAIHPADLPVHARGRATLADFATLRESPPPARPTNIGDPPQPWPTHPGAHHPSTGLGANLDL